MKQNLLFAICISLSLSSFLSACNKNKTDIVSSSETTTSISHLTETPTMTESYKKAREEFAKVSQVTLPSYDNLEVESHEYHEGDTAYTIDIIDGSALTYNTYLSFEGFFKGLLGNPDLINPTSDEGEDRFAQWNTSNNRWFSTKWEASKRYIHIATDLISIPEVVSDSYKLAKQQFYQVTHVELPSVYSVEASRKNIDSYFEGQDEYQIDLVSGSRLNYETYTFLEEYLISVLGECISGYPVGDETNGRTAKWKYSSRDYELKYNNDKTIAIYTKTHVPQMTESYKNARINFHSLTNIWLLEVFDAELLPSSSIDLDNKTTVIVIPAVEELFASFVSSFNTSISKNPTREETYGFTWIYDFEINNQKHQSMIDCDYDGTDSVITIRSLTKDYHSIVLTSGKNGSVKMSYKGQDVDGGSISLFASEKVTLSALADSEYEFDGWYIDNQLVSSSNPSEYTIGKNNVSIEGRFKAKTYNMTESYKNARNDFHTLTDIYLPTYEALIVDYQELGENDETYSVNITGGDNLSHDKYLEFKSFFDSNLSTWNITGPTDVDVFSSYTYTSKYHDEVMLSWNNSNNTIVIYASFPSTFSATTYLEGRGFIIDLFNISLPEYESVVLVNSSFTKDGSASTFEFSKDSFDQNIYNDIKTIVTNSLNEPILEDEDIGGALGTVWDYDMSSFTLTFSALTKTISIAISQHD